MDFGAERFKLRDSPIMRTAIVESAKVRGTCHDDHEKQHGLQIELESRAGETSPMYPFGVAMFLVGFSVMVSVRREFAALDRNSSILPAAVLLIGSEANEVATPLPMLFERHTFEKSMKPPGAKSAPPMWNASGE